MSERPNNSPETVDWYRLDHRTLREWHYWLTTDRDTGEPSGHLECPASRYGSRADECAWWAIAAGVVYTEVGAPADEPEQLMDFLMGLVVNDHPDMAQLVHDSWYSIPADLGRILGGKSKAQELLS